MRRFGILTTCFLIIMLLAFTVSPAIGSDGTTTTSRVQDNLSVTAGADRGFDSTPTDTFYICQGETIYDTLVFQFDDMSDTSISLELIDGPGSLTYEVTDKLYGYYSYTPTADGDYYIQFLLIGPGGDSTTIYRRYWVYVDESPTLDDQYHSAKFCSPGETRYVKAYAHDPEGLPLNYELLSGYGSIDSTTGWISYIPDTSGIYIFEVAANDDCSADTGLIYDTMLINTRPVMVTKDTTIYICNPGELCFDVEFMDIDGDSILVDQVVGPGSFTMISETIGQTCFDAGSSDSATYKFIYSIFDVCNPYGAEPPNGSRWLVDSLLVTVVLNKPPVIYTPEPQTFYTCEPDTFCFTVDAADPELGPITYNILSGNATINDNIVCVAGDSSAQFDVVIEAVDNCGNADTGTVSVTIEGNRPPYVRSADDFDMTLCVAQTVCFPATVDDPDFNIADISVNYGTYNEQSDIVCFDADTSGQYVIITTAVDTCGLTASDTTIVTINNTAPPSVSLSDTTVSQCSPETICIDAVVTDPDNDIAEITVNQGTWANNEICFTPPESGQYDIILTATDSCGNIAVDTAVITVLADQGITLETPGDTSVFTCTAVDTFCFPIYGIPNDAEVEVTGINTWYDPVNQTICYWSECSNQNLITITAANACDTATSSFTVTVVCNTNPLVILPPDTSLFVCQSETICMPVGIADQNNNLQSIEVTGGVFNPITSSICFETDTAGIYRIAVTATDSCGATDYDEMLITVTTGSPPQVSVTPTDTTYQQCQPEEICLSVDVQDVDDDIVTVTSTLGTYDSNTGTICFTPTDSGTYCGQVIAVDACGLADTADFCVTVETGDFVQIECPTEQISADLCKADSVCVALGITGSNYQVTTSFGSWNNDQLCFYADTSGLYEIMVTGNAACNSDTCLVQVNVTIAAPITIVCPPDTSIGICGPDTASFNFTTTGPVDNITVNSPAFINGQTVYVPLTNEGEYNISLLAMGQCGQDSCSFTVTVTENNPPVVVLDTIAPVTQCELEEICIPVSITDPDGNITEITSSMGNITGDSLLCFTAPDFGTYDIEVVATDGCGASDADTVRVTIMMGGEPTIVCPTSVVYDTICGPDTVCVSVPIGPSGANITILPGGTYNPANGLLCVPVDQSGTVNVTVIAEALCGVDTCQFDINVVRSEPTTISCPNEIDTVLCLATPQTLKFPVTVTGTDVQVTVNPSGSYANDSVSLTVSEAGTYEVDIIADGFCGVDTCHTSVTVSKDQAPTITLPSMPSFTRCLDDTSHICIDGIYASDTESEVTLSMTYGVGDFELIGTDSGKVCFLPDSFGVYQFYFEATDGCNTTVDTLDVEIIEKEDCDLCVSLSIEVDSCVVVGVQTEAKLYIDTRTAIGGFNLLISYDASVLVFNWATIEGTEIAGWEYFTYRLDDGACGQSCPSGLVRLIGIAETNNGNNHPPQESLTPNGLFIRMSFYVANDQNIGGQFIPISFAWYECGDNAISDQSGNDLLIDLRIYNSENQLIWDEGDDINYPSGIRPFGLGAPDVCVQPDSGKPSPIRCVEFINGGICVTHPDSIDDRGDLNLNGIAYEIADAILYSNYFVHGIGVLNINVAGQVAASDVNADGITLSVGDLVYLIRVIVGDANPIPRVVPHDDPLIISSETTDNGLAITTDAQASIGAIYLVYDINGDVNLSDVRLGSDATNMDLLWDIDNNQLKVLVYNLGNRSIDSGRRNVLELPYSGTGSLTLSHIEAADYYGQPYRVMNKKDVLPTDFALQQNYPNPFNPTTTISFSLPYETDWRLSIYNVTGGLVREFDGSNSAGQITLEWNGLTSSGNLAASGVYFYRLEADKFTDTKKMVLLK